MKKSLLTLITLALVLVNLVLTAIIAIAVVPEINSVNSLISKVSEAIDLDSQGASSGGSSVSLKNVKTWSPADTFTVNLMPGDDGVQHYAVVTLTLSLDSTSQGYADYNESMDDYTNLIVSNVSSVIGEYTMEQLRDDKSTIEEACLDALKEQFGEGYVVGVSIAANYQ